MRVLTGLSGTRLEAALLFAGAKASPEVKRLRARLVLGSGTAWEYLRVLSAFCPQPPPQAGSSIQLVRLDAACRELQSRRAPKATQLCRGSPARYPAVPRTYVRVARRSPRKEVGQDPTLHTHDLEVDFQKVGNLPSRRSDGAVGGPCGPMDKASAHGPGTVGSSPTKVTRDALARQVVIDVAPVIATVIMAATEACGRLAGGSASTLT